MSVLLHFGNTEKPPESYSSKRLKSSLQAKGINSVIAACTYAAKCLTSRRLLPYDFITHRLGAPAWSILDPLRMLKSEAPHDSRRILDSRRLLVLPCGDLTRGGHRRIVRSRFAQILNIVIILTGSP